MHNFKVGDTVQLNSCGELMTIESFDEKGKAYCLWFLDGKSIKKIPNE